MVNEGYQADDKRIVDYRLWPIPGTRFTVRGPRRTSLPDRYFVALGAAQTFGRFVKVPYPQLLEKALDLPAINLGFSGAGPSFFLRYRELLDVVNRAEFVIVQMMSGRSVENSVFELGINQGLVRKRGEASQSNMFAEDGYRKLLQEQDAELLIRLRAETRDRYAQQTIELLRSITPPKTLLYWSTRTPEYREGLADIGSYWGAFPHFVTRDVVDRIKAFADNYVEVVTNRGMPQPIFDMVTGEPVVLWDEIKFPHVKFRAHNQYYPSPEMHVDAAKELLRNPSLLSKKGEAPGNRLRPVIVHFHIFKNAGSSIDEALLSRFGKRWRRWDPEDSYKMLYYDDAVRFLEQNPAIDAISSHQLRPPLMGSNVIQIFPIVFLRHPILRVNSIYAYERFPERKASSKLAHTIKANELSLAGFVEWALQERESARPISNYQVLVLSRAQTMRHRGKWDIDVTGQDLFEATAFISSIPVVGVVEDFAKSAAALMQWLDPVFSGITFPGTKQNESRFDELSTAEQLAEIQQSLGKPLYEKLLKANELDLELYHRGVSMLARLLVAGIDPV